ncbi:MAG: SUMF1/EgtB/PvdO family nonheme iron enzyme, partial [Treponema sp.]|nr:SUMF1/EgtB/PvdO family nonheme iron enzyme [Treponema sp.]
SFKNVNTRQHHQVGKKKQNRLGLCDMSGNIYEWCWDYYNDDVTAGDAEGDIVVNPCGPVTGEKRVYRGGSWNSEAKPASVRYRSYATPGKRDFNNISIQNFHYGFRVACSIR